VNVERIPVGLIYGNPNQPRKTFDDTKLHELASSILTNGLKQPITVRPDGLGQYMIVMGERRFRAHQILAEIGEVIDIDCHISTADDCQLAVDAIIENDQRVDVHPLEQAMSYQRMLDKFGFDVEGLATKLGKSPHRIEERLKLLKLTDDCRFLLSKDHITPTQAWYLSDLSASGQSKLLKAIQIGQCPTTNALKSIAAAIKDADAQVVLFELPANEPTPAERQAARGFERKIESVADMLRAGIGDNEIRAVKLVDPSRAGTMAELLAAMQKDLARIECALRVVAVQHSLAA
jgi:ParB family transcriptional regulator, chromosome partitioning protein